MTTDNRQEIQRAINTLLPSGYRGWLLNHRLIKGARQMLIYRRYPDHHICCCQVVIRGRTLRETIEEVNAHMFYVRKATDCGRPAVLRGRDPEFVLSLSNAQ